MTHNDAKRAPTDDQEAREKIAALLRRPWYVVAISGTVVLVSIVLLVLMGKFVAGLVIALVPAALIFAVCLGQAISFSPAAVARLKSAAEQTGGRFTLWKAGPGPYTGVPFEHGIGHDRFGVLDYVEQGLPVEVGHLLTTVDTHGKGLMPNAKRTAFAAIQLPERMAHMVLDFGRLSRFLGVRMAPEAWHRSQLVDVGGGRRFRLFVADGEEQLARAFFTPELVHLLQQIGRRYDVEIKDRYLYLFSTRSLGSGSDRRWQQQRTLIEGLARSVADSPVWDLLRRRSKRRSPARDALRRDDKRVVIIIVSVAVGAFVVLSAIAIYLWDQGLLKV
ncbi:hypothetical protein [Agrococcus sp. ARC_14]|uniref:hypothetical protein n=1 Tax=Agrococcus sp. ARC_14 TaxID=2919927 RepID=UPI001F05A878|nr:hypothetical protein [Agrococcus sp. ARC_14]MCH1881762.1 hypothetical protein [Agrococcus sp. ARC_14]